ncbi:MAG TPA: sugar phosphate isomerase/epimerase [Bryobacteraceae bacterium]|nr:sugar phosphate isomerase/epimerase [Bryobacteraceae bacterium]
MSLTNLPLARREFLLSSVPLGAGLTLASSAQSPAGTGTPGTKMPRFFSGCCAYSYRKYLQHGPMTMEEFIQKAVSLRLDGVDMTAYYFKSTEPAYLASLRHLAYRSGVMFSGAACGVSMVQADAAKRAGTVPEIKKWVDVTDALGASHLRIFGGKLPPGVAMQQSVDWVVEAMKAACDYSGAKGITLGVEDHSGVTQQADVCLEIMHRVNSPYAGINLDITHFVPTANEDAYAQIEACIPYATNTHIRDKFDDGSPIDLDRVWRLFAQAGFKGFMSAEYEDKEDAATGVPKLVEKIRTLCAKYSTV